MGRQKLVSVAGGRPVPEQFRYNDPSEKKLWYLDYSTSSHLSIDAYSIWEEYTGKGVKIGVLDSQIDFRHPELAKAYDTALDFNFALGTGDVQIDPAYLPLYHGTMVAGIISAEANNDFGTVGIASGATLVGLAIDYSSNSVVDQILAGLHKSAELDVVNNSWRFVAAFGDDFRKNPAYQEALQHAAAEGRGGLGTSVVFAAGNTGSNGSANYNNFQNSPFTIAVGSVDPDGNPSSFTSLGANVLLSAAGRDVVSTDLNGRFDEGAGTSYAAPAVAATIGLMLEANPDLGYRDVQQILAYSSRREGLTDSPSYGDGWRYNGATNHNGGGLHFSDAFGYGYLNVHDAVRLAETWSQQQTFANLTTLTKALDLSSQLVAGSIDHISVDIEIADLVSIEHVQLAMDFKWRYTGDLDVYLTSPGGTQVRLVYDLPNDDKIGNLRLFEFSSVASMGEESLGTWTLDIVNRNPHALDRYGAPEASILEGVTLTVQGRGSDLQHDSYVYTDEFGSLYQGAELASRSAVCDTDGGIDTINAAAVTTDCRIDLTGATASMIAGIALDIDKNAIENAFGGDGNDILVGTGAANTLLGGRGNDAIYFSFGNDTLDGGQGSDTLFVGHTFANSSGYLTTAGEVVLSAWDSVLTTIHNIESFVFTDVTYSFGELVDLFGSPDENGAPTETPDPDPGEGPAQPPEGGGGPGEPPGEVPEDPAGPIEEPNRSYAKSFAGTDADDRIRATDAADRVEGLGGNDYLLGQNGDDGLFGQAGDDKLRGGAGHDLLEGGEGNDRLFGDAGNDILFGGIGADALFGDDGDDWIEGGRGSDTMKGGLGADTFVFNLADIDSLDIIFDFSASEGDRIVVTGLAGSSDTTVGFVTRGKYTYLEMRTDAGSVDLARIQGSGITEVDLHAADFGWVFA